MKNCDFRDGELYQVKLSDLNQSENQPRKLFDDDAHELLKNSIKENQLLEPILFTIIKDEMVILSGSRRCRAMVDLGNEEISARFIADPSQVVPLIANIQRENLLPIEVAEAFQELKEKYLYSNIDLGKLINKSAPTVSEILKLNFLPEDIKAECRKNKKLVHSRLLKIAHADDERSMRRQFKYYLKEVAGKSAKRGRRKKSGINGISSRISSWIKQIQGPESFGLNNEDIGSLLIEVDKFKACLLERLRVNEPPETESIDDTAADGQDIDPVASHIETSFSRDPQNLCASEPSPLDLHVQTLLKEKQYVMTRSATSDYRSSTLDSGADSREKEVSA